MKYLCIKVWGDKHLADALDDMAATDWRLHTLTFLGSNDAYHVGEDSWHLVMEKGV